MMVTWHHRSPTAPQRQHWCMLNLSLLLSHFSHPFTLICSLILWSITQQQQLDKHSPFYITLWPSWLAHHAINQTLYHTTIIGSMLLPRHSSPKSLNVWKNIYCANMPLTVRPNPKDNSKWVFSEGSNNYFKTREYKREWTTYILLYTR